MTIKVNEIFYSIQGEALFTGCPSVFVRLTGCNLRCSYCDTIYAYNEGRDMEIPDILHRLSDYNCRIVEITGGEPLLQDETPALVDRLLESNYTVLIETNGSMNINMINEKCIKIVDIKCPSSNESDKNDLQNLKRLNSHDQIKFVIGNRDDYEYAKTVMVLKNNSVPDYNVFFSTVTENLSPAKLAEWMLKDNLKARFQLQLHKIIWPDIERGV
ncbi:MAG: radical SAM protein [Desulfobacteraceae bacterium]|jgi:7-carboxy-7-deazaguanine synthase|nr:radical SAM protein [Desulfobacteraceae bacterium]